ncbi:MAG: RDD family protein, partial [Bosea sp. (in: a-proteobacteria)]
MRVSGVKVERSDGGPPDGITAAAHCLLFYAATFTIGLLVLNILFGILRSDGRMGHDLLTGLVIVRN